MGANRRPRIGVTAYHVPVGDDISDSIPRLYTEAVANAGGLPLILPSIPTTDPTEVWETIDGLLLTGGGDMDPATYGQEIGPETKRIDRDRDTFELAMLRTGLERRQPILGVCRGFQVLVVALGGSLVQHLPDVTQLQHSEPGRLTQVVHQVDVAEGSVLATVAGPGSLGVNSFHHQGAERIPDRLEAVAWADDGLVEGIELPGSPALAVQWHPEAMVDREPQRRLFEWLVDRAREGRPSGR